MTQTIPHFTPGRVAGQWVFVSGQLPMDANRKVIAGGIREQTAKCLENVAAILAKQGLSLDNVVKTTVWLTRTEDFAEYNKTYAEYFKGTPPARSTVRADLMVDALIEIEAIALREV